MDYDNLPGANFANRNLETQSYRNAYLVGASFVQARLSYANFSGAVMRDCNLQGATAKDTHFIATNLANSDMDGGQFNYADFTSADLSNVSLNEAQLYGATFTDATIQLKDAPTSMKSAECARVGTFWMLVNLQPEQPYVYFRKYYLPVGRMYRLLKSIYNAPDIYIMTMEVLCDNLGFNATKYIKG